MLEKPDFPDERMDATLREVNRSALLALFGRGYEDLTAALARVPPDVVAYKPRPDAWSVHEIVLHITDTEAVGFARFRWAIAQPGTTITPYDQDIWANQTFYAAQNLDTALATFRLMRQSTYECLLGLPESAWNGWIQHPERGVETLERILQINAEHVPLHIRQIEDNIAAWQHSTAPFPSQD